MIPTDSAELVRRFGLTIDGTIYRGHILGGDGCPDMRTASTFNHRLEWTNDRHREIHVSETELAVFTFCEGDLALQICPTRAGFDELIQSCAKFYTDR